MTHIYLPDNLLCEICSINGEQVIARYAPELVNEYKRVEFISCRVEDLLSVYDSPIQLSRRAEKNTFDIIEKYKKSTIKIHEKYSQVTAKLQEKYEQNTVNDCENTFDFSENTSENNKSTALVPESEAKIQNAAYKAQQKMQLAVARQFNTGISTQQLIEEFSDCFLLLTDAKYLSKFGITPYDLWYNNSYIPQRICDDLSYGLGLKATRRRKKGNQYPSMTWFKDRFDAVRATMGKSIDIYVPETKPVLGVQVPVSQRYYIHKAKALAVGAIGLVWNVYLTIIDELFFVNKKQ